MHRPRGLHCVSPRLWPSCNTAVSFWSARIFRNISRPLKPATFPLLLSESGRKEEEEEERARGSAFIATRCNYFSLRRGNAILKPRAFTWSDKKKDTEALRIIRYSARCCLINSPNRFVALTRGCICVIEEFRSLLSDYSGAHIDTFSPFFFRFI